MGPQDVPKEIDPRAIPGDGRGMWMIWTIRVLNGIGLVCSAIVFALLVASICSCTSSSPPSATQIHPSAASAAPSGPVFDGAMWAIGESTGALRYPLQADVGATITEWLVFLQRDQLGPSTTARLQCLETVSATHLDMSPAVTDDTSGPGYVALHMPACSAGQQQPCMPPVPIGEDCAYVLIVAGDGVAGDRAGAVTVYMTGQ